MYVSENRSLYKGTFGTTMGAGEENAAAVIGVITTRLTVTAAARALLACLPMALLSVGTAKMGLG